MNRKSAVLLFVALGVVSLSSCSGPKTPCTDCNGGGNANLTITMYDTPPTGTNVLSFTLPVVGMSLTPSSGSAISVYAPASAVPFELTHLQTDSALVVSGASIPAGTYTALNITTSASSGIWINSSGSNITYTLNGSSVTCLSGAVCVLPSGAATTVNIPISLTLSGNQNQWIGVDVNLSNAIVTTNGIGVDFTQPKVFTATTTTRTGLPAGAVDTIEDFAGKVTAFSASSISVQSALTGQTLTATVTSSTGLSTVPSAYNTGCQSGNANTCLQVGSIVSLYANLAANGKLTATELDLLDTAATDEIEGVIYPASTTAGVVGLILFDKTSASGNAILAASTTTYGTPILLDSTSNGVTFSADSGPLTSAPGFSTVGFSGTGSLLAGQMVRVQVSNIVNTNNTITATATNVLLRWSRFSASLNSTGGNTFTLTGIPAYMSSGTNGMNPGVPVTPQAITYQGYTAFDGITGTTDSSFQVGTTLALRALFLDTGSGAQYSFQTAKVRVP